MKLENYIHNISTQTFKRGHVIFKEGEEDNDCLYFVFEGKVDIVKNIAGDNKIINSLDSGTFFGEMALLKNIPRSASAIVAGDHARLARIDKSAFLNISKQSPDFLFELLKVLIERLHNAENRLNQYVRENKLLDN